MFVIADSESETKICNMQRLQSPAKMRSNERQRPKQRKEVKNVGLRMSGEMSHEGPERVRFHRFVLPCFLSN